MAVSSESTLVVSPGYFISSSPADSFSYFPGSYDYTCGYSF
jgi:hypothetical protein